MVKTKRLTPRATDTFTKYMVIRCYCVFNSTCLEELARFCSKPKIGEDMVS